MRDLWRTAELGAAPRCHVLPGSPLDSETLEASGVSFERLKLTNNEREHNSHVCSHFSFSQHFIHIQLIDTILNFKSVGLIIMSCEPTQILLRSMERYQPRIHLLELFEKSASSCPDACTSRTPPAAPHITVAVSSTAVARTNVHTAGTRRGPSQTGTGSDRKSAGWAGCDRDAEVAPSEQDSDPSDLQEGGQKPLGVDHVLDAVTALGMSPVAVHTFVFRQLRFIAVTAYQNQLVCIPI